MDLYFNTQWAKDYKSSAQIIRVLSEHWFLDNMYCPCCGAFPVRPFKNNHPVGDFYCASCAEQFELKSKNGKTLSNQIADGAYHTMIERISSNTNPNFFFLNYDRRDYAIYNLIIIPKHFFTPEVIVARNKGIADRPNYIMCAINTAALPSSGKISIVHQGKIIPKHQVLAQWQQTAFLKNTNTEHKSWLLTILYYLDKIPNDEFSLRQLYAFEHELALKYPKNSHIKDKIRQQLQFLRDKGLIKFMGGGRYRKLMR